MDEGARPGLSRRTGEAFHPASLHRVQRPGKQTHQIDHRIGPRQGTSHAGRVAQVRTGKFHLSRIAFCSQRPCLFRMAADDSQTRPCPQQGMGKVPPDKTPSARHRHQSIAEGITQDIGHGRFSPGIVQVQDGMAGDSEVRLEARSYPARAATERKQSPGAKSKCAQVAELVDALASGASARKGVEVRVLSWAPFALPASGRED
ncbi:hypothetical protein E4T56_gene17131 [Termitomyces sp. T112]|nr:hypothetical protein E4T56_gene17131 [Termitomyces sp. T112]